MPVETSNPLGAYLKDRRSRLDPATFGFAAGRRRPPGLRREEVAQRANISPTWYTWLEQGRGGAPSADVLNRIAGALMLTDIEREHVFLLGLGRPPEVRYRAADGVTPRLQRLLDAFEVSPALIKTATWDVVAWNRAATVVLWRDNNVHVHGEGIRRLRHPILGPIMMEYSAFAVDGRPDLGMIVYNPATASDAERIRSLVASQPTAA
jgi:transcriptional regulator with XRE-family HTH domain